MSTSESVNFSFIPDTYETEILKTISVWGSFTSDNWRRRPSAEDVRGRTAEEHFMHQCVSEDTWCKNMLAIDLERPPLPSDEPSIISFMRYYSSQHPIDWPSCVRSPIIADEETAFFDVPNNGLCYAA